VLAPSRRYLLRTESQAAVMTATLSATYQVAVVQRMAMYGNTTITVVWHAMPVVEQLESHATVLPGRTAYIGMRPCRWLLQADIRAA
jgi:hypothetical protein